MHFAYQQPNSTGNLDVQYFDGFGWTNLWSIAGTGRRSEFLGWRWAFVVLPPTGTALRFVGTGGVGIALDDIGIDLPSVAFDSLACNFRDACRWLETNNSTRVFETALSRPADGWHLAAQGKGIVVESFPFTTPIAAAAAVVAFAYQAEGGLVTIQSKTKGLGGGWVNLTALRSGPAWQHELIKVPANGTALRVIADMLSNASDADVVRIGAISPMKAAPCQFDYHFPLNTFKYLRLCITLAC